MSAARHAISRRISRRFSGRLSGRFTTRAAILAVIVCALLLASIPVFERFFSERSQEAGLKAQVARLEQQLRRVDAKIRRYQDPSYLEQVARECLGMVKPGEVPFVIVPKHAAPKPASC
jgi:cell division protein FtsB